MSDSFEQLDFFNDPEQRVNKSFKRANQHQLTHRGRKLTESLYPVPDEFDFYQVISEEYIRDYGLRYQDKFPLFNDFNDHAHIEPNNHSIDEYCSSRNKDIVKNWQLEKSARQFLSIMGLEVSGDQPLLDKNAMRRQTNYIADNLQRNILINRDTYSLWRASIKLIRRQVGTGALVLDESAVSNSASAIMDFGRTVIHETQKTDSSADKQFGLQIVYLMQVDEDDLPSVLRSNPRLLNLVQHNLKAHEEYWSIRYQATLDHLGKRLTKDEYKNSGENLKEIVRLNSIVR